VKSTYAVGRIYLRLFFGTLEFGSGGLKPPGRGKLSITKLKPDCHQLFGVKPAVN
jgi:hypothetical protein